MLGPDSFNDLNSKCFNFVVVISIFSWSCQWLAWDGLGAILILRFVSCTCLQRDFLLSLYCCLFFWGIFPLTKISFVVSWPQMTILSFSFYFPEAHSSFGYFYAPFSFNILLGLLFSFSHYKVSNVQAWNSWIHARIRTRTHYIHTHVHV